MLNNQALNQLAQLKKDIQDSKEYGTGTVVGSNGRFGFVRLEDGRDAYLSPEKMQRVIPGDTVKISINNAGEGKLEAVLEKLVSPGLECFIGQYRIKGNAHFVQPSGIQSGRWIFVPPKSRSKCQEGDCVIAKILNHPFRDGKASAKIVENVGRPDEAKFEQKYIKAKYQLNRPEDPKAVSQTEELEKQFIHEAFGERSDLTEIPFVTIDAETTKDMDDALAIETVDVDGNQITRIHVAIADPSHFIAQDSPLAKASFQKSQSTYLLGGTVPMLPAQLSHHSFSLEANKKRPALVSHIDIDATGEILNASFEFAVIESKHKLSYEDVAAFLDDEQARVPDECKSMLKDLHTFSELRRAYRQENFIVSQDQGDYDYQLDDNGKIESIQLRPRTSAHQIVEEAMLSTNMCGAALLAEHQIGLCVAHKGFRPERLGEVKALLKEENISHGELNDLESHVKLFHELEQDEKTQPLIAPLRRMMDNIELTTEFGPHLGMGLPGYATITSPIRRYADLYNHWALQKILLGKNIRPIDEKGLSRLADALLASKQADRELSQWLVTLYTEKLIGNESVGRVRIVTQHGFGVRLDENGIEGFVLFPKDKEKKYDAKRMTLTVDDVTYRLGEEVKIKIKSVDKDKRRIAFELSS